ncbi:MAG: hypothetical protein QGH90_04840 [Candidatus Poseidoniaceae archaeon]|jgi:hypothetical protein|nr:hypothetical protein [Candidatus Poseidoniaceae archaeon]
MSADVRAVESENREQLMAVWLILSCFGIMFAVLSWLQEAAILPSSDELGVWKGVLAVLTGLVLYWSLARKI